MELKFIDKSFYEEIAPKCYEIADFHAQSRTDLFREPVLMTKKEFKKRVEIKGFIGIAAYENESLCGYCFCRLKKFASKDNLESKSLWIDEFFICKEYRRLGYGTQLFNELKKIAESNNCCLIEFDVWQMNEKAQKFYDSLGCKTQRITKELIL